MKVILYMAMSLNGVIARENNKEDFLSHKNWEVFIELAKKSGCIIWGRKTNELVRSWGKPYTDDIQNITKVVVSSHTDVESNSKYILAASPAEAIEKIKKEGFKEVILAGGSQLNSSFAKEDLIDEIVINIEPVIIGKGISLFFPEEFSAKLKLLTTKQLGNIIQLHYKVVR